MPKINHVTFLPLQIDRDYSSKEHTASEVKQEIEMHLQEKEVLENVIPSNIMIGPFYVNTESVRQGLSKKRKAMANALLELLAKKLRTQAEDVSVCYLAVLCAFEY